MTPAAQDDVSVALPDDPAAARRARELTRTTLVAWGLSTLVEDAELAVSELVTNAFRHGLPPVVLRLRLSDGTVRMDVTDARPATATRALAPHSQDGDESGRGRAIIAAVSDHCGTEEATDRSQGKSSHASWDIEPRSP